MAIALDACWGDRADGKESEGRSPLARKESEGRSLLLEKIIRVCFPREIILGYTFIYR
ncbi:MAG: hypothetical protein HC789_08685 [Microcoleus sp. CSU_2_2]|nr:hypothetical protein [Microcoleus sp. SU_5_3]NJS10440.1 hypothetical protein [Microcoleus sp. CSU_2_2]